MKSARLSEIAAMCKDPSTAEAKREAIRIMLDNVFRTSWARHAHWGTLQFLHGRLFFREALTDEERRT